MTEKNPESLAKKVIYKEMELGMRKRREQIYSLIPKTLEEVDQFMKSTTLGLYQNYHGLFRLEDGTPTGILMYHEGFLKILAIGNNGIFFITLISSRQCILLFRVIFSSNFSVANG